MSLDELLDPTRPPQPLPDPTLVAEPTGAAPVGPAPVRDRPYTVRSPGGQQITVTLPETATDAMIIGEAQRIMRERSTASAAPSAPMPPPPSSPRAPAAPGPAQAGMMPDLSGGMSGVPGAILDTVGLGRPGARTVSGVLFNPQTPMEHVASGLTQVGLTGATGGAFGAVAQGLGATGKLGAVAPWAGRMAATAGIGAEKRKAEGRDPSGGLLDAAAATVMETLLRGVPKVGMNVGVGPLKMPVGISKWGESARQLAEDLPKAITEIRSRLPAAARFNVPSLSATPLTLDQAITGWVKSGGAVYERARQEILREMQRLDMATRGSSARASHVATRAASPEKAPGRMSRGAYGVERGFQSQTAATAADVVGAGEAGETGIPYGAAVGGAALVGALGTVGSAFALARRMIGL